MDQTGREIKSAITTATVAFTQNSLDVPPEANVQTTLELPPGDYEIRMAVEDPADAVGSVFAPVKIPPFGTAPLSVSDVIVQASGGAPPDPSSFDVALSPTTRRTFASRNGFAAWWRFTRAERRTTGGAGVTAKPDPRFEWTSGSRAAAHVHRERFRQSHGHIRGRHELAPIRSVRADHRIIDRWPSGDAKHSFSVR